MSGLEDRWLEAECEDCALVVDVLAGLAGSGDVVGICECGGALLPVAGVLLVDGSAGLLLDADAEAEELSAWLNTEGVEPGTAQAGELLSAQPTWLWEAAS